MKNERGFILILTFVFMVVLMSMVGGLMYMAVVSTRNINVVTADYKLLSLADAGVQRAYREIRDEISSASPATGTADLRGNTTSGTAGTATQRDYVRYYNEGSVLAMTASGTGTYVILQNFDLNYLSAIITSVKIGCRYAKASTGGQQPSLEILYTTNGTFPQAGNSSIVIPVPNSTTYNVSSFIVLDITNDRTWSWPVINNANFQIRARAYNSNNRNVNIDYLFLQVTYQIDTLKEKWADGTYVTFPITLGAGAINSISITDEQSKIHLNTASQTLLSYLMQELGITAATANTLATNIVTYRTTKYFDSVEELQQVTGMTSTNYNLIKNCVTVYSFINSYSQRTTVARAPININTAPLQVLKAVFDPLGLGTGDPASLANDIITTRTATPFTCFYSADAGVATDFYDFVKARTYLTATEQNIVLDNADASLLVPVSGATAYNSVTTEFVYNTNVFKMDSLANMLRRSFRVKTIMGSDGSRTFTTYNGDALPVGYRKENFE